MVLNWEAIESIASAIATIAALIPIILSIKNDKNGRDEKQLSAQACLHVTSISHMGSKASIKVNSN
ncbi:hypothetical protein CHH55_23315 [Niallia circulans]|nr:hypothetical protein CHH55_23315 [Niallia circulans]